MCNLTQPQFQDADAAREYLEAIRWGGNPVCPHCGAEGAWPIEGGRKGLYKCKEYQCRKQFTVTVGTVFEGSRVPLNKWLMATYLMASSKKGISAKQLERTLGVTYKTAWFMAHRIREAMKDDKSSPFGAGGGLVEVDETYLGKTKGKGQGTHMTEKRKVISLVDRETKRSRSLTVDRVDVKTMKSVVEANMAREAQLMTDGAGVYKAIGTKYAAHHRVDHSAGEYVSKDNPEFHTNTVEGYFSLFKRGLHGIYQHCGEQHLNRYLVEFDFRYNFREKNGYDDSQRSDQILKGIGGKRLTYQSVNVQ